MAPSPDMQQGLMQLKLEIATKALGRRATDKKDPRSALSYWSAGLRAGPPAASPAEGSAADHRTLKKCSVTNLKA